MDGSDLSGQTDYDAIVIGGGPGGSTAALVLARAGRRVLVLEKDLHPRFHIGESILPRNAPLLRELGLEDEVRKLPHLPKYGAEFAMGDDFESMSIGFTDGLLPGEVIFNIERAPFDHMLLTQAEKAGATVLQETPVTAIERLTEDGVSVAAGGRAFTAKVLIDASGHGTVVGRHLKQRRNFAERELQKVAYFQHFDGVERVPGQREGNPTLVMADEGWFWIIGLSETKTSVGFVTRPDFVKTLAVPADRLLQWAIARCPVVRHRMRDAVGEANNRVIADFSYTCKPFAGPGYFLVGDAGCFLDPIFSTGVTLAMVGGQKAARLADDMLAGRRTAKAARRDYVRFVTGSTSVFWRLIRGYYKHPFRELFLQGQGPHAVHKAVISTLAGQVFPRPVFALRWRVRLFEFFVWLQHYVALAPRRPKFRLIDQTPIDLKLAAVDVNDEAAAALSAAG